MQTVHRRRKSPETGTLTERVPIQSAAPSLNGISNNLELLEKNSHRIDRGRLLSTESTQSSNNPFQE